MTGSGGPIAFDEHPDQRKAFLLNCDADGKITLTLRGCAVGKEKADEGYMPRVHRPHERIAVERVRRHGGHAWMRVEEAKEGKWLVVGCPCSLWARLKRAEEPAGEDC